jgi:hypothetical protein
MPEANDSQTIPEATVASYLHDLQCLISSTASPAGEYMLIDHLDRGKLDFGLESLQEIDRYLTFLHDNEQEVSGISLLSTIWAIAFYVGEVIRRQAPERQYEWVNIGADLVPAGFTTIKQAGIGTSRALRAKDGEMCMPSLAVLRIILRGAKARTIDSYARGAIGLLG